MTQDSSASLGEFCFTRPCLALLPFGRRRSGSLLVAALCFCHLKVEAGVLGLGFRVKPVRSELPGAADPSPVAHQTPVPEETADDLHAIEPVQVGVWLCPGQMHGPYPHILAAMSCSSLPTASA
jgi:hypothetical protein